MRKLILLFILLLGASFFGNTQTVEKLVAYTKAKFNEVQFTPIDSTVLIWGNRYKENITYNLLNKIGLGLPRLTEFNSLFPQPLSTAPILPDSIQYLYVWNNDTQAYVKRVRTIMTKNLADNVIKEIESEYDSTMGAWSERNQGWYTYDNQERLTAIRGSVSIFNYYGDSCFYDQNGRIVRQVRLKRNNMADSLDYFFKNEYDYDSYGLITEKRYEKFNLTYRYWKKQNKWNYTYDNGNIKAVTEYQWNQLEEKWKKKDTTHWYYNSLHKPIAKLVMKWENNQWKLFQKRLFTYDGSGHLINKVNQTFTNDSIVFQERFSYVYNGNDCLISAYSIWNTTTEIFEKLNRWVFGYDVQHNCVAAQSQTWDNNSWGYSINDFNYHFFYHNESYLTTNLAEENMDNVSVYPNPTADEVIISSIVPLKNITIIAINGKKKIALKNPTEEVHVISVQDWPNGTYIINAIVGNKKFASQFIVQH